MSIEEPEGEASHLLAAALDALEQLPAAERVDLLRDGHLERLVAAIAPRFPRGTGTNIYEYLLENKQGLSLLAQLRLVINNGYSIKAKAEDQEVFISPDARQWFDDGVIFLQGKEPFAGLFGLYQNGQVKFAIAARAAQAGDILTPDYFLFLDVEELKKRPRTSLVSESLGRKAIAELEELLTSREIKEQAYQSYFGRFPWVLGAQHKSIQSHEALDDRNIPDFTGIRVRDDTRDILEIKSPFLSLLKANGDLAADFNNAWNQTERYLDFCRREDDYLRRKGLVFENPHCFLLVGYGLTSEQLRPIRAKERMNPAITVLTYDDVLTFARSTVQFLETFSPR